MNYFALFHLPQRYAINAASLTSAYHLLSRQHHPDQADGDAARRRAMEETVTLNEAYAVLKDPVKRAYYLLSLYGASPDSVTLPQDFLEAQLDAREAAEDALTARDDDAIDDILNHLRSAVGEREQQLADFLDEEQTTPNTLERACQIALEMQFLQKFASDIEERSEYE
jgi:molecular chaperone HscB